MTLGKKLTKSIRQTSYQRKYHPGEIVVKLITLTTPKTERDPLRLREMVDLMPQSLFYGREAPTAGGQEQDSPLRQTESLANNLQSSG